MLPSSVGDGFSATANRTGSATADVLRPLATGATPPHLRKDTGSRRGPALVGSKNIENPLPHISCTPHGLILMSNSWWLCRTTATTAKTTPTTTAATTARQRKKTMATWREAIQMIGAAKDGGGGPHDFRSHPVLACSRRAGRSLQAEIPHDPPTSTNNQPHLSRKPPAPREPPHRTRSVCKSAGIGSGGGMMRMRGGSLDSEANKILKTARNADFPVSGLRERILHASAASMGWGRFQRIPRNGQRSA